jgi:glycosyltransferase involved in cell wall biosynthesis
VEIARRYAVQFVHSPGYSRNVGLQRLSVYRFLRNRFKQLASAELRPDVIVAAIPSLEWAEAAAKYGRVHGVPVVIDVRDLWPDVYLNALPSPLRPAGRVLLGPYFRAARRACAAATVLAAISHSYLDWALRVARRPYRDGDFVAPLGFEPEELSSQSLKQQIDRVENLGIDPKRPICLFAGSFERSYDLETVIDAARRLKSAGRDDVQFVLCGDGSRMAMLERRAAGVCNVFLPGRADAALLQGLRSVSVIGLCAYSRDAFQSIPNKPFEYMCGRLAIVSSLTGEMAELIKRHQCGLTYRAGDAESLARAIGGLLNDPARLSAMRSNGYRAWSENYRSDAIYERFVRRLENISSAAAKAA